MLERIRKLFGGWNLTWPKLIIMAVLAGAYTAAMAILPQAQNTSFHDIAVSFEVWILFGILIITNSRTPRDSALKCFVFFLISQPLVYLIQVPFASMGWGLFVYYKYWFLWTILTLPMGFVGWYMKKDRWWGILILAPMLIFLAFHAMGFLTEAAYWFPRHLLSAIFCFVTMILYVIGIFRNKIALRIGLALDVILIALTIAMAVIDPMVYSTDLLVSGGSTGVQFDDSYKAWMEPDLGEVSIVYEESLEDYALHVNLRKAGKTQLILEAQDGQREIFDLDVKYYTYDLTHRNSEE